MDSSLIHLHHRTRPTTSRSFLGHHLSSNYSDTTGYHTTKVHGTSHTMPTWCRAHRQVSRSRPDYFWIIVLCQLMAPLYPKSDGPRLTKWTFDATSKAPCLSYPFFSSTAMVALASTCGTYFEAVTASSITRLLLRHSEAGAILTFGSAGQAIEAGSVR